MESGFPSHPSLSPCAICVGSSAIREKRELTGRPASWVPACLCLNRRLGNPIPAGNGVYPFAEGSVGRRGLLRFGKDPTEKRIKAITRGHRVSRAGDIGLQFFLRSGVGRFSQIFHEVGELMTKKKCPGIGRHLARSDRMNENGALIYAATNTHEWTGIFSTDQRPANFSARGFCHFTCDGTEFGEVRGRPIARVRSARRGPADRGVFVFRRRPW